MFSTTHHRVRRGISSAIVIALVWTGAGLQFDAFAVQGPQIMKGGVKVAIDFADQQQSKVVFIGDLPSVPGLDLNNQVVSLNVGGIQRNYVLSPDGEGVATPDLFQLRTTDTGYSFILSTLDNSLANAYQPFGFINQNSTNVAASMPVSITLAGVTYKDTLTGVYDAQTGIVGKAFLGVIQAPADPFAVVAHISTLAATPNPTQANQVVTIKGTVSLKNFTGGVAGNLHFGDMSAPIHADGATFQKMLKAGISHTYTADGVYVARVSLIGGDEISDTRLFVIVGDGFVVNSENGAVGRLVKVPGGGVSLQVGVGNVPGAMTAQTKFLDMKGNTAGVPPAPPPPGGQMGLTPSNTFTSAGIFVAESMALDQGGNALGMLRKTIVISSADVGSPAVRADGTQVASRDSTTDSTITLSSMSGKFLFTSSSADTVIFNGSITLPDDYVSGNATGNDITFAMGNVSDTVHLDSKNKFTSSTQGYITRFKLTTSKKSKTAKLSVTMNTSDLDVKGFDSEGISVSTRSDETGQT